MRRSFGAEVAFARNRKYSKIPSIQWRADSALATHITVASFDPRSSRFERHAEPTSELQTKFTAQRSGAPPSFFRRFGQVVDDG